MGPSRGERHAVNDRERALDLDEAARSEIERLRAPTDEHGSYDDAAILRYARAAKSWCERGSWEMTVWERVIVFCGGDPRGKDDLR